MADICHMQTPYGACKILMGQNVFPFPRNSTLADVLKKAHREI